jgi:hypothetical protein
MTQTLKSNKLASSTSTVKGFPVSSTQHALNGGSDAPLVPPTPAVDPIPITTAYTSSPGGAYEQPPTSSQRSTARKAVRKTVVSSTPRKNFVKKSMVVSSPSMAKRPPLQQGDTSSSDDSSSSSGDELVANVAQKARVTSRVGSTVQGGSAGPSRSNSGNSDGTTKGLMGEEALLPPSNHLAREVSGFTLPSQLDDIDDGKASAFVNYTRAHPPHADIAAHERILNQDLMSDMVHAYHEADTNGTLQSWQ